MIPTVTLSKVFRYGEGGLMKVATDVRLCKRYLTKEHKNKVTQFGNNKDYVYIDVESGNLPRQVVALYRKLLSQGYTPEDMQVLTSKNVGAFGTIKLNKYIQRIANPPTYFDRGLEFQKPHITYGRDETAITNYEGDLVIQIQNNYRVKVVTPQGDPTYNEYSKDPTTTFIANGETGRITYVGSNYVIINFDDTYVKYSKDTLKQINLGYSISIHKSQGSTIKIPILITTSSDVYMLNSNLLYVGLTRMKDKCFHFGTVESVNRAVVKKANLTRHTFMVDLLTNNSTKQEE
jgi:exodeoxyribonuclease V alpha subunit